MTNLFQPEGMGSYRQARKPSESFVVWNERTATKRKAQSRGPGLSHKGGTPKRRWEAIPYLTPSNVGVQVSFGRGIPRTVKASGRPEASEGVGQRKLALFGEKSSSNGEGGGALSLRKLQFMT